MVQYPNHANGVRKKRMAFAPDMVTQTRKHHEYAHLFEVKWKNANNPKLSATC
jgi:hypothetical protein